MAKKIFLVTLDIEPDDFCDSDLQEALIDGLENVGNYQINDYKIKMINKKK